MEWSIAMDMLRELSRGGRLNQPGSEGTVCQYGLWKMYKFLNSDCSGATQNIERRRRCICSYKYSNVIKTKQENNCSCRLLSFIVPAVRGTIAGVGCGLFGILFCIH
jgi:hypothetical protein